MVGWVFHVTVAGSKPSTVRWATMVRPFLDVLVSRSSVAPLSVHPSGIAGSDRVSNVRWFSPRFERTSRSGVVE